MQQFDYDFWVPDFDRAGKCALRFPVVSKIFNYPYAFWFGWKQGRKKFTNLDKRVQRLLNRAHPKTPVMVMYNLPDRDLGHHSKGGAVSDDRYYEFLELFARSVGDSKPILIFEPDGLPHITHMEKPDAERRFELMRNGIDIILKNSGAIVYVDVGHSNWLTPAQAGNLINQVALPGVRGFSVNVSNYRSTPESMRWALQVAEHTEYNHFVIDTSRNGNGPYGNDWCNPPGRALGTPPTTDTGEDLCDAFLWIKVPGESDGTCNGGPKAGTFWPEYAKELISNTDWIN
jgi:endoglucanase